VAGSYAFSFLRQTTTAWELLGVIMSRRDRAGLLLTQQLRGPVSS
jgi:hypothetical protein